MRAWCRWGVAGCKGAVLVEAPDGSHIEAVIRDTRALEALMASLDVRVRCAATFTDDWIWMVLVSGWGWLFKIVFPAGAGFEQELHAVCNVIDPARA
jgi:hypothetical protein